MSRTTGAEPARASNAWWVAVVCGMASYIDACAIMTNGNALVMYQQAIGLTQRQFGGLSGALTFAIAVGALVGGRLGDRFGRRPVFQATMLVTIIGVLCLVFGPGFWPMLAGIVLVGLGTGADLPVSLATIAEAGDEHNRGALVGLSGILWLLGLMGGVIGGVLFGGLADKRLGGQLMYGQIGVVALLVMAARQTIGESGTWLAAHGTTTSGEAIRRSTPATDGRANLGRLLHAPYLLPFVCLAGFYTLVNLGANTGGQFTSLIWYEILHKSVQYSSMVNLCFFPAGVVLGVIFMRTVDTRWRMPLFYVAMVCQVLDFLVPAAAGFHLWSMLASITFGGIGGAFAFEGIMKVWTQEAFPTLLRSTAQGTIIAVARFAAGAFALVTPSMISTSTIRPFYWVITAMVVVGYVFALWGFHDGGRNEFSDETA